MRSCMYCACLLLESQWIITWWGEEREGQRRRERERERERERGGEGGGGGGGGAGCLFGDEKRVDCPHHPRASWFRVEGLGFRFQGLGCRV